MGRPFRACLRLLAERQYGSGSNLSATLRWALEYLQDVASSAEPKPHKPFHQLQPMVIIYTDAAEKPDKQGGLIITCGFVIHGIETIWGDVTLPAWVIDSWEHRKRHIAVGGLLVVPMLALEPTVRPILAGSDSIWFLDNVAALGSLIRGSSTRQDMSSLAMQSQVALYSMRTCPYFEWVRSQANIADAPSRGRKPQLPRGLKAKRVHLKVKWESFLSSAEEARKLLRSTDR